MRGAVASFATTWMLLGARITGMDADNWVWVVLAPMQKSPVLRQLTELMNMTPATAARPVAMRGCQLRSVVYILCVMALGMRGGMSGRMAGEDALDLSDFWGYPAWMDVKGTLKVEHSGCKGCRTGGSVLRLLQKELGR